MGPPEPAAWCTDVNVLPVPPSQVMDHDHIRPWREIAVEVGQEQDLQRLLALCLELEKAFQAQTKQRQGPQPEGARKVFDGRKSA